MIEVIKPNQVDNYVKYHLDNTFNSADPRFQKIVSKLAAEIESELQYAAPEKTSTLRFSIKIFKSRKNRYFMWVGPEYTNRRSYNKGEGGNHAHLVEYGTKERYMKKGLLAGGFTRESGGTVTFKGKHKNIPYAGKYTGKMGAKPFMRPTYDKMNNYIINSLKEATLLAVKIEAEKNGL